ncbi:hypothetical protein BGX28_007397 [Mortierella sp. GBA30]|nr:hypothetical protein BGX28_007397 [Mortierella sp. GBA30]
MDILQRAQSLLQECNDIILSLEAWKEANSAFDTDGVQKILHAEQKFLEKVTSTPAEEIKPVQISSSNVPYLKSLVWALIHSKNPVAIRKTFTYAPDAFTAIEPTEKFKAIPGKQQRHRIPKKQQQKGDSSSSLMQLSSSSSQPLSTNLSNIKEFQVKVDLVADHGKSWLRINAASTKSLIHEFADMEEDSDEDEDDLSDEESEQDSDDEQDHNGIRQPTQCKDSRHRRPMKPAHVSKNTHADMTLLTRSLVLAADQNRLHYHHRPYVTLMFTGAVPEEEHVDAVKNMIQKSVRVGQVAQSIVDGGIVERFPVDVTFGPMDYTSSPAISSGTNLDPLFLPSFSIPRVVDDMVLFTKTLHLDITTLMALSSFLCHTIRPDPGLFTSPPLILQAKQEHDQPLLPLLGKIFEGREQLVMSRTAVTRFRSILEVIGGPEEKWRGRILIHDPQQPRVREEGEEDEASIKERWIRGSDWAQQYGVFADGPPRIAVIEDLLGQADMADNEADDKEQGQDEVHNQEEEQGQGEDQKQEVASETVASSSSSELERTESPTFSDSSSGTIKPPGPRRKDLNMAELHSKIFMTGHNARLTTVTANLVGYRTVTRTGQVPNDISVWFHQPRSLAEAKLPSTVG